MFLDFTHKLFFFWKLLTNFNSCSAKRYFFGKPKLHPNSIIHSSLYYMTSFSIAGCLKIKTIATTKTIIYLFIYLFIYFRIKKTKIKEQDGWQETIWRICVTRRRRPSTLDLWHNTLANWATKLGHLGCYKFFFFFLRNGLLQI